MAAMRQQILVLWLRVPDPGSTVCAWSFHDGASDVARQSGDADEPPYASALAAMRDGWRVLQFPQAIPAYPGAEQRTTFLKHEYVLERLVAAPETAHV